MGGPVRITMRYGVLPVADGVSFKIEGLEEVIAKTKSLSHDIQYKGGRFALRKAAQVIRDSAKQNAQAINDPSTSEEISKNIVERWSGRYFKRTGGDMMFRVGVLGGARQYGNTRDNVRKGRVGASYVVGGDKSNPGGDTFYWRFLEFGTEDVSARPFMRPALSQNVEKTISEFVRQYGKSIDRALKRAKK